MILFVVFGSHNNNHSSIVVNYWQIIMVWVVKIRNPDNVFSSFRNSLILIVQRAGKHMDICIYYLRIAWKSLTRRRRPAFLELIAFSEQDNLIGAYMVMESSCGSFEANFHGDFYHPRVHLNYLLTHVIIVPRPLPRNLWPNFHLDFLDRQHRSGTYRVYSSIEMNINHMLMLMPMFILIPKDHNDESSLEQFS